MTECIKIKYDLSAQVFEYEGPIELLDEVIEKVSRLKTEGGNSDSKRVSAKNNSGAKGSDKTSGKAAASKTTTSEKKNSSSAKVAAEKFDIYGDGKEVPKLSDFFVTKDPGTAMAEKIVVIAYYITEILGHDSFSDGQIEFAFKMLKLKRPTHLRQIITNAKNEKDWFDKYDETSNWSLTRGGELFVSDDLPRNNP